MTPLLYATGVVVAATAVEGTWEHSQAIVRNTAAFTKAIKALLDFGALAGTLEAVGMAVKECR